jgi:hypothetical protein
VVFVSLVAKKSAEKTLSHHEEHESTKVGTIRIGQRTTSSDRRTTAATLPALRAILSRFSFGEPSTYSVRYLDGERRQEPDNPSLAPGAPGLFLSSELQPFKSVAAFFAFIFINGHGSPRLM